MRVHRFIERLASTHLEHVFNPWGDVCPFADRVDGASVRRANLAAALERAVSLNVGSILIGRDLGYRGGRRTGLALTDEANLPSFARMYGGLALGRATRGPIVAERTAAMFWEIVTGLREPVFTWNVFPYHPHSAGKPLSNRCHSRTERKASQPILLELLDLLQPSQVIALGNDAEMGLADLGIPCVKVRHPSYGGKAEFVAGMLALHPGLSSAHVAHGAQPALL